MRSATRVSWERKITIRVATKTVSFEVIKEQFVGKPSKNYIYVSIFSFMIKILIFNI